jgi:hypothetical protein
MSLVRAVWKISDSLRYTVLFAEDSYATGVRAVVERFAAEGIEPVSLKNYWGGDGYQGINDVFGIPSSVSLTGVLKVEVQFHTSESFAHKTAAHMQYEEFRSAMDPNRKMVLYEEMVEAAKRVPMPTGVLGLQPFKKHVMPVKRMVRCLEK